MPVACDIIIPAYNSGAKIVCTLSALFEQKVKPSWRWRIIVSDDGSTDTTVATIYRLQPISPCPLLVLRGSHQGSAAARNRALEINPASIILFLGSDIVLHSGALQAHADFHTAHPDKKYAALGHIRWDPRLCPTPFMEWMVHGGPQNDFDALVGRTEIDPAHYFYGSHLSLKKEMIGQERFNEKFSVYGWEDLEFGRRLAAQGLILKFLFNARGVHNHSYSTADIIRRQRLAGAGLHQYQQSHPDVSLMPPRTWRTTIKFFLISRSGLALALRFFLRYSGKRWTTPRLFFIVTAVEYWRGIFSAQRSQK